VWKRVSAGNFRAAAACSGAVTDLDPATLEACRRGDAVAFRRLVEAYQRPVIGLCVALAGSEGEDLAQETFVRVHRAISRFDPAGAASLRGWILCIARRLCRDRARALRRRGDTTAVDDQAPDRSGHDPSTALERADRLAQLGRAIAALPEEQRAVLALFEWEGLDYGEIAAIEEVPIGTVRSRLSRAREALRAALAEDAAPVREPTREPARPVLEPGGRRVIA
jgi:RNA polymerase sigma-70 factor (ECF subfamily)